VAIRGKIFAPGRSIEGPRLLGAALWVTVLAAACTTTLVPFDPPPSNLGAGGARSDGDAAADGGGADREDAGSDRMDGPAQDRPSVDAPAAADAADAADADAADAADGSVLPALPTSPTFKEALAAGPLSGSTGRYVQVKCCPSAGAANCVSPVLGSTVSCLDASSWKQNAALLCESMSLVLSDYGVYGDCSAPDVSALAATKGPARFVEFNCCVGGLATCLKEMRGRNDLCFSADDWTALVKGSCDEVGGKLQIQHFYGPC